MTLPNLAVTADLSARGIAPTDVHDVMLSVASSLVRSAAQSPILSTTSTVTLWSTDEDQYLELPGHPVTAISSVVLDGTTLDADDYKNVNGRLWRSSGWLGRCEPVAVEVTMTHGYTVVPEHIKQLVCDLAILGATTATSGAHDPSVLVESIDDYSVTFTQGSTLSSAMELPAATKNALRKQFGGGAAMVLAR